MNHINATPTRLVMRYNITINKQPRPDLGEVYEGEVPMSDQEAAGLKGLLGDMNSKVTVSRELGKMDYGNGGKVFVSVTLTCDQSEEGAASAASWANHLADKYVTEYYQVMETKLAQLGLVQ